MPIDLTGRADPVRGAILVQEAESALNRGDRGKALEKLLAATRLEPFNDTLALQAAVLHYEKDEFAEAARMACEAIRIRPYNPPALNVLGVACIEAGRPDLAKDVLYRAVRFAPGFIVARKNLKDARRRRHGASRRDDSFPVDEILTLLKRQPDDLSACILVREGNASAAIESLQGLASEIVVLDSRADRSEPLDLPEEAKLLAHPWNDNRSDSWNHAILAAGCHWVLLLEDCESLADDSAKRLRSFLRNEGSLHHPVTIRSGGLHSSFRLLRNAPEISLQGRTVEEPAPAYSLQMGQWELDAGSPGIVIDGDTVLPVRERERQLLERDAAENPEELHAPFLRSWLEACEGRVEGALETVRKMHGALERDPQSYGAPERERMATLEGFCHLRRERYDDLLQVIGAYHENEEPTANSLFLQGVALKAAGRTEEAVTVLRRAVEMSGRVRFCPALPAVAGAGLPNILGAACLDGRDLDGAVEAFGAALEREPDSLEARLGLIGIRSARREIREVLQELDALVEANGERRRAWTAGAGILLGTAGMAEAAVSWLQEALRRFPGDAELRERLGAAHLSCGSAEGAMEAWEGLDPSGPASRSARVAACLASGRDMPELPGEETDQITAGMLSWYGAWASNDAVEALDRALTGLERAAVALPRIGEETAAWLDRAGQPEAARKIRKQAGNVL